MAAMQILEWLQQLMTATAYTYLNLRSLQPG